MYEPGVGTAAHIPEFEIDGDALIKYHGHSPTPTVPPGVRVIGEGAFANQMITSVSLPDSVEVIGPRAFQLCMRLSSVRMPSRLERIEAHAFEHCRSLLMLILPEGLRYIGERAFSHSGMSGLAEIPASVEHLGREAFSYCPWLSRALFHGSPREIGEFLFAQCGLLLNLHAPADVTERLNKQGGFFCNTPSSYDPGDKTGG